MYSKEIMTSSYTYEVESLTPLGKNFQDLNYIKQVEAVRPRSIQALPS
jgi:hypothetical protein